MLQYQEITKLMIQLNKIKSLDLSLILGTVVGSPGVCPMRHAVHQSSTWWLCHCCITLSLLRWVLQPSKIGRRGKRERERLGWKARERLREIVDSLLCCYLVIVAEIQKDNNGGREKKIGSGEVHSYDYCRRPIQRFMVSRYICKRRK